MCCWTVLHYTEKGHNRGGILLPGPIVKLQYWQSISSSADFSQLSRVSLHMLSAICLSLKDTQSWSISFSLLSFTLTAERKERGNPYFSFSLPPSLIGLCVFLSPAKTDKETSLPLYKSLQFSVFITLWCEGLEEEEMEKFWVCNHTNSPRPSPRFALLSTPLKLSPIHDVHTHIMHMCMQTVW